MWISFELPKMSWLLKPVIRFYCFYALAASFGWAGIPYPKVHISDRKPPRAKTARFVSQSRYGGVNSALSGLQTLWESDQWP
jgi:hypothetical protein